MTRFGPRLRRLLLAAALVLASSAGAGCGGQADEPAEQRRGTTGPSQTSPSKQEGKGRPPRVGTVIRSFQAKLVSPGRVAFRATLSRPTTLALQVTRLVAPNPQRVGRIDLGRRQGQVALSWDLQVRGKRVAAGRYRLRLVGGKGAGRSRPVIVTVPAG